MSNPTTPHKQQVATEIEAMQLYKALHDLKAPLASMQGLMMLFKKDVSDQVALCYLDLFEKCYSRLNTIVTSLQDIYLYRYKDVNTVQINVNSSINNVIESLRHMEEAKDIEFVTELTASVQYSGDQALFESILQNVIHNSIIYRRENSKSCVRIKAWKEGDRLTLTVEDNGKGISADVLPHVFEMFYRGNHLSKGSGLGLYIVKNSAELLKGTVEIESAQGEGTKVSIQLTDLR